MRARPGDLGLGPPTAGKAASDTRCRSGSHIIAWRLCISRPATIFSSGSLHTSAVYTILGGLYKSGVASLQFSAAIQRWTCHPMLDRPCNSLPAMQLYTGEPVSREPVSREPMPPSASVERVNAWNNCVTYIIPPTGHLKLHTNYIYRAPILHRNYISFLEFYM